MSVGTTLNERTTGSFCGLTQQRGGGDGVVRASSCRSLGPWGVLEAQLKGIISNMCTAKSSSTVHLMVG